MTAMILQDKNGFVLPELQLSSLPTGAVKQLVNQLGKRIANGEYPIGSNIPMEPELVAEHQVSRTVVREAIKVLSGKGMVRTARRYGTNVCNIDEWNLLDPDVIGWHAPDSPMAGQIFVEASDFRLLIEPHAAASAATRSNDLQRELILKAAHALDSETEVNKNMLAADFAFHATVLDASGSLLLKQFRGFLHAVLDFSYTTGTVKMTHEAIRSKAHSRVADAIVSGDAELARQQMHAMLKSDMKTADSLAS